MPGMDQTRPADKTGPDRDYWTLLGLVLIVPAAAAASWIAWSGLAVLVGMDQQVFGPVRVNWLIALSIDGYALVGYRLWMRRSGSAQTRAYAKVTALAATGLSVAGNALFHLIPVLDLQAQAVVWPLIVVAVTGLPAVQLGLVGHLISRREADRRATADRTAKRSVPQSPASSVVSSPALLAVPTSGPVRSKTGQTADRLAAMRSEWPDRMPTKREVMDRLEVKGSQTATDLLATHRAWLAGREDRTEPEDTDRANLTVAQ